VIVIPRKKVWQKIEIREPRFGVEPEMVAKIAQMHIRVYEVGISYRGRTYAEGKKIGVKDGFRALYCIFRYNAHKAPLPIQFLLYLFIGGTAAIVNLGCFLGMIGAGLSTNLAAPAAFFIAAAVNYLLCVLLLFRRNAYWNSLAEPLMFFMVVAVTCVVDLGSTTLFLGVGLSPAISKATASIIGLALNFLGRRFIVFPESPAGPWK